MTVFRALKLIAGLGMLFATAACAPNADDFMRFSGYDAQGLRTGSVLPSGSMLTPY